MPRCATCTRLSFVVNAVLSLCVLAIVAPAARGQDVPLLTPIAELERGFGNFIEVVGGRAYVTSLYGLEIIDIGDPHQSDLLGTVPLGSSFEIAVAGEFAYVQSEGIKILNVGPRGDFTLVDTYGSPGYSALVERDGLLFAVRTREGLEILDITDPEAPRRIGQYLDGGYNVLLDVMGEVAYLGDMRDGIEILDISDPTSPHLIARLPGTGSPDPRATPPELYGILTGLLVHEDLLIVGLRGSPGRLRVYDLSNPDSPRMIAEVGGFTKPCKLTASGDIVVLSDDDGEVAVVDIGVPPAPQVLGRMAAGGHDLHLDGEYLYIALRTFQVFRLQLPSRDPTPLNETGGGPDSGPARAVEREVRHNPRGPSGPGP